MNVKEWWSKPRSKNLVFLVILVILFFSPVGRWIQTKYTQWQLDEPLVVRAENPSETLYRYEIRLTNIQGEELLLSDLQGKPVFLNMWASWCMPCRAEFPGLEKLQAELPELQMVVLNIEKEEPFQTFVSSSELELPFYRASGALPKELTPRAIPASYLIDAQGKIVYEYLGAADWGAEEVVEQIKALVAE